MTHLRRHAAIRKAQPAGGELAIAAQTIVEAPKNGASSRAAAISAPRLAEPTTNPSTNRKGAVALRFALSICICLKPTAYEA